MNTRALFSAAGFSAGCFLTAPAWAQPAPAAPLPTPALPADTPVLAAETPKAAPPGEESSNSKEMAPPAAPEPGADTTPPPEPAKAKPARRARPHRFHIQAGLRTTIIPNEGYDPFAEGNGLAQGAFSFAYSPWRTLPFSVYGVGEWSIGGASSVTARGADSALVVNRLGLGVEGRYEPISRLYMYVKLMPTAMNLSATINEEELSTTLMGDAWTWGLDTTGGAAIRVGNVGRDEMPKTTFWFLFDLGYSFAGEAKLVLKPRAGDDSLEGRRFGGIPLTPFRPSGVLWRFAFSVAF